jgi:FMN phosphatase YigB (HAD superfamily)
MVGDSLENDVLGALDAGLAAVVWLPGQRDGELPAGAHLAREIAEVPHLLGLE